jgi:putative addiction module component (TIGR02574 family)
MTVTMMELEAQVLNLAPADRAHLLERLIDSFEPEGKVRDAWIVEAQRRHEEIRAGTTAMVPGQEALARIRARIA